MERVARFTNLTTGGPVHVDVQAGKILRIVPLELDDSDGPSWTIEARGRSFTPPRRTTLSPYVVAHKSTIYSPKRFVTPTSTGMASNSCLIQVEKWEGQA
jgi:trimethylamine-N-oxide reductase (cytochrome c)